MKKTDSLNGGFHEETSILRGDGRLRLTVIGILVIIS